MHIRIKKGVNIPISGSAELSFSSLPESTHYGCDFTPFSSIAWKIVVKEGQTVAKGEPLAFDKGCPERIFPALAGGIIKEIQRGEKRKLLAIFIEKASCEREVQRASFSPSAASKKEILDHLLACGLFLQIKKRPLSQFASPEENPKHIFVKAADSAPFAICPSLQVKGHEEAFQTGIEALAKLTSGSVHLICKNHAHFPSSHKTVVYHTIEGPHPVANLSVAIQRIAPICSLKDILWTVTVIDVVAIGYAFLRGTYWTDFILSLAGEGFQTEARKLYRGRRGMTIDTLTSNNVIAPATVISGNPLTGKAVSHSDALGFFDTQLCAIPQQQTRPFLPFLQTRCNQFTATRSYLSGLREWPFSRRHYPFTTNSHGEERAFLDTDLYDDFMPFSLPVVPFIKALLCNDFETATALGLLEIESDDFALPAFLCPSKIDMISIVQQGIAKYAEQYAE